jgi:hypothetical protein
MCVCSLVSSSYERATVLGSRASQYGISYYLKSYGLPVEYGLRNVRRGCVFIGVIASCERASLRSKSESVRKNGTALMERTCGVWPEGIEDAGLCSLE